ncbi:Uncharacterized protein FKW44_005967, partial [Caligus rogercresseyi]
AWRHFCSKAANAKDIAKLIKIQKPIEDSIGLLKKDDGYTQSPAQSLLVLMETHFPDSIINTTYDRPLQERSFNINYVNKNKVKESFNSFEPFKSSGPDGLKPVVLQQLGKNLISYITNLYE